MTAQFQGAVFPMSARTLLAVTMTAATLVLARPAVNLFAGPEPTDTTAIDSSSGQHQTTTLDDQSEVSVTVYNSDIALVRDVRNLQLSRGTGNLRFMDIAATVNPATVHFRSLTEPQAVSVLEQNYEYDLLDPDKLLRKYVGREVTLIRNRHDAAGRSQSDAPQLQHRAGVEDRQRDRDGAERGPHQLSAIARHAVFTAH